ncbi:hypothetical protein [Acetobacter pasteurianus]|uniref:hypothetical protein n=1 Tax=Acetobacter pasteurianus TaxID=438 RepID=UPI000A9F37A0|nr:hypothetical protein [Acetobacter pasteurianus]
MKPLPVPVLIWCLLCAIATDLAGYLEWGNFLFVALGLRVMLPRWIAAFKRHG